MTLREMLKQYYVYLRRHRSRETLRLHRRILNPMIRFLGKDKPVKDIKPMDVDDVAALVNKAEHAPSTRNKHIRVLRRFYNWAVEYEFLERSPARRLKQEKLKKKKLKEKEDGKAISEEDIQKMLDACQNVRDEALVTLFRDTGVRLGGAWNLTLAGLDFEDHILATVEEKKEDDEYEGFMSDPLMEALEAWLKERSKLVEKLPEDHGFVFVRLDNGKHLKRWGLFAVMRRLGERAGVKNFSPHKFRHAWGRWAASKRVPVTDVQDQLGHDRASTTMEFYYKTQNKSLLDRVNERAKDNEKLRKDKENGSEDKLEDGQKEGKEGEEDGDEEGALVYA